MSTTRGVRAENRERLESEIVRLGRAQLAQVGPAALSLRAVARELGMASSAVYRYVPSRDALLTRLIVESYDSLGQAVEEAEAVVDRSDLAGRWHAVGTTLRRWALAHPHDWALLYGTPVPGYDAPAEQTGPAGTRVTSLLIGLLVDIAGSGRAATPHRAEPADEAEQLARTVLGQLGLDEQQLPPALVLAGLAAWTLLVGAVSSEVFEQQGPQLVGPALFDHQLALALSLIVA